jgi:hypothetical protein
MAQRQSFFLFLASLPSNSVARFATTNTAFEGENVE